MPSDYVKWVTVSLPRRETIQGGNFAAFWVRKMSTFIRLELDRNYRHQMTQFYLCMENDKFLEAMKHLAKATKYHGELIEAAFPVGK